MNDIEDLITDYLTGALDPAARLDFERRMAADPELAARVALESELAETLGASPENKLRSTLRSIADQYDTPESLVAVPAQPPRKKGRLGWGIALLLLLGIGIALFLFWPKEAPETALPLAPPGDAPAILPGKPAEKPPKTDETQENNLPRPARPVAADFRPIQQLETYIGSQVRSGAFRLRVDEPRSGAVLPAGTTNFRLSGKTEGAIPAGQTFHTMLFSNDLKDFEAMRPIENLALVLQSDAGFTLEKKISFQPGLYYIIVEEEQSGEWVFVDKFLVK